MSELEPEDSRVVHGNAKPKEGDKRFAQEPQEKEAKGESNGATKKSAIDDEIVRNPAQSPSTLDEEQGQSQSQSGQSQSQQSQFEASDLDRGEMQYQGEPLVQQQHQADDWSANDGGGRAPDDEFETGQADYGSRPEYREEVEDEDIETAAPKQAKRDRNSDRSSD